MSTSSNNRNRKRKKMTRRQRRKRKLILFIVEVLVILILLAALFVIIKLNKLNNTGDLDEDKLNINHYTHAVMGKIGYILFMPPVKNQWFL